MPETEQGDVEVLRHGACVDFDRVLPGDLLGEGALDGDMAMLSLLPGCRALGGQQLGGLRPTIRRV